MSTVVWLSWIAWRSEICKDQKLWPEIGREASDAWMELRKAVVAFSSMLVHLAVIFVPFFSDLGHRLSPYFIAACDTLSRKWHELTPQVQDICVFVMVGVILLVVLLAVIARHIPLGTLFYQLSFFLVIGPILFFVVLRLPHRYAMFLAGAVITVVPVLASLLVLAQARQEQRKFSLRNVSFWRWDGKDLQYSKDVEEKLRHRLSFYALKPFLDLAFDAIETAAKGTALGIAALVTLALWVQFWGGSWMMLRLFRYSALWYHSSQADHVPRSENSEGGLCSKFTTAVNSGISWVAGSCQSLADALPSQKAHIIAFGVVVMIGVSLLLDFVGLIIPLVTFVILSFTAFDSARLAAKGDEQMCAARLAFWVLALLWLFVVDIPVVGHFMNLWTPLVLAALLFFSETIISMLVLPFIACVGQYVRSRCSRRSVERPQGGVHGEEADVGEEVVQPPKVAQNSKESEVELQAIG